MIIDNLIKSADMFISIFNLKFEEGKLNELSLKLENDKKINILNKEEKRVGALTKENEEYRIKVILDNGNILTSRIKKENNETSRFTFNYIISEKNTTHQLLNGVFSSKKMDSGKICSKNDCYILGKYKVKRSCILDSINNTYLITNKNRGYEIEVNKNMVYFKSAKYKILIKLYDEYIYFEKIYFNNNSTDNLASYEKMSNQNESDVFSGYEVSKTVDFIKEAKKILEYIAPEYFKVVRNHKYASDKIVPGMYDNTLSMLIDKNYKRIFIDDTKKEKTESRPKKLSRKEKKREAKRNKKS